MYSYISWLIKKKKNCTATSATIYSLYIALVYPVHAGRCILRSLVSSFINSGAVRLRRNPLCFGGFCYCCCCLLLLTCWFNLAEVFLASYSRREFAYLPSHGYILDQLFEQFAVRVDVIFFFFSLQNIFQPIFHRRIKMRIWIIDEKNDKAYLMSIFIMIIQ